jgi:predicted metal-dependent peptidase
MDLAQANKALDKAKLLLMSTPDSVFFTTLCFSLKHVFDEKIPTARCDGRTISYSPKFFMELNEDERVFLILHEVLHAAYLHMLRFKDLDKPEQRRWNIACDHVINLQLIDRGFKMPGKEKAGFADPQYKNMSSEEVYKLLEEPPSNQPYMYDLVVSGDPGSPEETQSLEAEMRDILVRASLQSKMAGDAPGTIPGEIEIFLQKLNNPKLPWQNILRKYFLAKSKTLHSWTKPNRRFFPQHHLPTMYGESLAHITVAVDTSGSVSDEDFMQFISETHFILKSMKPEKITFIQFDTQIQAVNEVKSIKELEKLRFTGRGGTSVKQITEWAENNRPTLMLVFTDGHFHHPGIETKTDTIWLIHNNPRFKQPYGRTIHYEL